MLFGLSLSLAATRGSVPYDAASHVAVKSSGCGKSSPYKLGKTSEVTAKYVGVTWTFRLTFWLRNYIWFLFTWTWTSDERNVGFETGALLSISIRFSLA